jgi:hypothetical protein
MAQFFLIAFGFGLVMTLLSFLASGLHLGGFKWLHLPDVPHLPHGEIPHHLDLGHGHQAALPHANGHASAGAETPSAVTMPSILVFLTGMGGVGYLLLTQVGLHALLALGGGSVVGLMMAWVETAVLRALYRAQTVIQPGSDSLVGRPGTVSKAIRLGGTGEFLYVLHGVRQSIPARSEEGEPIPKGTPVAVMRVERGIVYVVPVSIPTDI